MSKKLWLMMLLPGLLAVACGDDNDNDDTMGGDAGVPDVVAGNTGLPLSPATQALWFPPPVTLERMPALLCRPRLR